MVPQATSDLIAAVFKLQTEVSRLKADVQRLGTPRDTPELRQKIAGTNDRLKLSAKDIGERLKAAATEANTPQIQKILTNFQVPALCAPVSNPLQRQGLSAGWQLTSACSGKFAERGRHHLTSRLDAASADAAAPM